MIKIYPQNKQLTNSITKPMDTLQVIRLLNIGLNFNLTDADMEAILKLSNQEELHHKTITSLTKKGFYPIPNWLQKVLEQKELSLIFNYGTTDN